MFSSQNAIEVDFKQAVTTEVGCRVGLADESKFGHEAFAVFAAPTKDIAVFIPGGIRVQKGEL